MVYIPSSLLFNVDWMITDDAPMPALLTAATLMLYDVAILKLENSAVVCLLCKVTILLVLDEFTAVTM